MQSQVAKAYEILDKYNGLNNQINYYKSLLRSKNLILSEFDSSYIIRNHDYEPQTVNKIVKISSELGNKLQEINDMINDISYGQFKSNYSYQFFNMTF